MLKANRKQVVLLLIFAFAFIYRLTLMFWNGFPPGADIGLHNSVIYSITNHGNVDFLYNFYHIGGGISLTFPGYHIFTAAIIMVTGLPEYVAQAVVVALFSSLLVFGAFLITKRVWSISAALIVAVLIAVSRFDIEMLMWAGYPNVITLLLIPLTFYLYLEKDRFSKLPFLVSTSIMISSLFLTHSLSAVMFVGIAVVTMLIAIAFQVEVNITRKTALYWFLPIVLGVALVLPFLVSAIPTYLSQYGSNEIASAIVASRILPLEVILPLSLITVVFLIYGKKFYSKALALPALLMAIWIFLPLLLTQGYVVGLPVDYNRFLYFLVLPVMVFIAVTFDYFAKLFADSLVSLRTQGKLNLKEIKVPLRLEGLQREILAASRSTSKALTRRRIYAIFVLVFLLFSIGALPIFTSPGLSGGLVLQSYYQTMDNEGWNAIQWIKMNTTPGSVLVSDALYGWWLGGFAQRQTLSAVSPEYLTVKREVDNSTFARNIMDTDYIIDNGLIQIREDGYLPLHIPELIIHQNWTYATYPFFTFDNKTQIEYRILDNSVRVLLEELPVKEMQIKNSIDQATIAVTRGNANLNFTQTTTVYRGVRFANITSTVTALSPNIRLDWVDIIVQSNGEQVPSNDSTTISMVDNGVKALGKLKFYGVVNKISVEPGTPDKIKTEYKFSDNPNGSFNMLWGAYSLDDNLAYWHNVKARDEHFMLEFTKSVDSALTPAPDVEQPKYDLQVFNYLTELHIRRVNYVICRDPVLDAKFSNDPSFSLVFINKEVAIFKFHGNHQ